MNDNILGDNLKAFRKRFNLTQVEYANKLGITNGYVSDLEKNKAVPSESLIRNIETIFQINRNWLLTGEGEMFRKESEDPYIYKGGGGDKKNTPLYNNAPGDDIDRLPGVDEFAYAVAGLKEIFDSRDPVLLPAIQANIRAFQISVRRERQIYKQEKEIGVLKEECKDLKARLSALEEKIRNAELERDKELNHDPPLEKKLAG